MTDHLRRSGDHSRVEPPGPVPNPEVKHPCADGSWTIGPVRVGRCQVICPHSANAECGLFLCPNSSAKSVGRRVAESEDNKKIAGVCCGQLALL